MVRFGTSAATKSAASMAARKRGKSVGWNSPSAIIKPTRSYRLAEKPVLRAPPKPEGAGLCNARTRESFRAVCDLPRTIGAAIIYNDDLESTGQLLEFGNRPFDDFGKRCLFIAGRHSDRNRGNSRRGR